MTKRPSQILRSLATALVLLAAASGQRFPEWRAAPLGWLAAWERSTLVVVGELRDVMAFGSQQFDFPPTGVPGSVHQVLWCEGTLLVGIDADG